MIPRIDPVWQTPDWQQALANAVRDPLQLCQLLELDPAHFPGLQQAHGQFAVKVPHSFIQRMQKGNPRDPLLMQVLPLNEESAQVPGYTLDPVGDRQAEHQPGLLQKYHGRVLFMPTVSCAVHCRYCFRRHYPYQQVAGLRQQLQDLQAVLEADPGISEVILSGGDPLNLSDDKLASIVEFLHHQTQVRTLRIHTRLPVVLPQRINSGLLDILGSTGLRLVMVLHCNHAQEIQGDFLDAMEKLRGQSIQLLNQTVLLRGINDNAHSLQALSEALFACGILPYYLHKLDKVAGAAHYDVDTAVLPGLMRQLRTQLPGYLVPRLVEEQAGKAYKQPLG